MTGRRAPTEEYVTAWDRPKVPAETDPETGLPKIEHARLDVSFIDGTGRRPRVCGRCRDVRGHNEGGGTG